MAYAALVLLLWLIGEYAVALTVGSEGGHCFIPRE